MKSYKASIEFLYGLQKSGMKFGLRNIRALLRTLGNPERSFVCIHIAGSNGKGSTAAMIAAILTAAGYRTGLYTSPHLLSFGERIRIDGKPMSRDALRRSVSRIQRGVKKAGATFFEATTAIAFEYFRRMKIDVGVIETGLGGRLDATNVVRPLVSVITTISLEHTQILGNRIAMIAYEKGGIIKRGVPCYSGVESPSALRVLSGIARARKAPLSRGRGWVVKLHRESLQGSVVDVVRPDGTSLSDLAIALPGRHQLLNAVLAIRVVEGLTRAGKLKVVEKSVRRGLKSVHSLTGIRSRLSLVRRHPDILADVAHNPEAAEALSEALKKLGWSKVLVIFGVMRDKNYQAMIESLAPLLSGALAVQPRTDRSLPASVLSAEFKRRNIPVMFEGAVGEAVERSMKLVGSNGGIVITGSHFVVGEALAALEGKKYLTINQ